MISRRYIGPGLTKTEPPQPGSDSDKICESVHCEKEAKEALTLEANIFGLGKATENLSHVFGNGSLLPTFFVFYKKF